MWDTRALARGSTEDDFGWLDGMRYQSLGRGFNGRWILLTGWYEIPEPWPGVQRKMNFVDWMVWDTRALAGGSTEDEFCWLDEKKKWCISFPMTSILTLVHRPYDVWRQFTMKFHLPNEIDAHLKLQPMSSKTHHKQDMNPLESVTVLFLKTGQLVLKGPEFTTGNKSLIRGCQHFTHSFSHVISSLLCEAVGLDTCFFHQFFSSMTFLLAAVKSR